MSNEPFDDPGIQVHASIQSDIEAAIQRAEAAQRVKERIDQVKGTAQSRGSEVSVACDTTGRILDLRLAPSAMRRTSDDLAALILETSRKAHQDAANKTIHIAETEFGKDSPLAAHVTSETQSLLAKR
jgi:DNA-binding protein YbaB